MKAAAALGGPPNNDLSQTDHLLPVEWDLDRRIICLTTLSKWCVCAARGPRWVERRLGSGRHRSAKTHRPDTSIERVLASRFRHHLDAHASLHLHNVVAALKRAITSPTCRSHNCCVASKPGNA